MPTPIVISRSRDDSIGPWSESKLRLLGKYLNAYTTVMYRQPWSNYHYIDAFAGTGRPKARDEERYVDGSPRVALNTNRPFHSYTFIEQSAWRIARLEQLQTEFPDRRITIVRGDCNEVLVEQIAPMYRRDRRRRGHVFLDPFTMNIAWDTVKALAATGTLEIFLNVPTMALNRVGLPNDPRTLTDAQIARNNRFWGTPEWRSAIYETVPSLFGPWELKARPTSAIRLAKLYAARLSEIFPHVTEPLVMTNSKGAPIYCLVFAGHHPIGAKIARDIFQRFDLRERQLPLLTA